MALSLPTFPTWLWRNPNHDPTIDSTPSPIPNPNSSLNPNPSPNPSANPNPNPNSNPNLTLTPSPSTHLSFSSSPEAQYAAAAILDGESNYQFQWINPNPSPNYSNHHQQQQAGEGNRYAAAPNHHNYREYHANRSQRKVITYRQQQRRRRANRPQLLPTLDLDFDLVVVPSPPSDHNWSGSESDGSDWSVGWFEPHGPEFCANDDNSNDRDAPENSFAVLVPCYGARAPPPPPSNMNTHLDPESKSQLWAAVLSNVANDPHSGTNHYLQQWLSSLQS